MTIDENTESFTALFTAKEYLITFLNWDGAELQATEVAYGQMPEYAGEAPTKPEDETYTYTFAGWSPEITTVTGEATYTALFTQTEKTPTGIEAVEITENGIIGVPGMRVYDLTGKDVTNAMDHLYQGTFIIVVDGKTKKVMIP